MGRGWREGLRVRERVVGVGLGRGDFFDCRVLELGEGRGGWLVGMLVMFICSRVFCVVGIL